MKIEDYCRVFFEPRVHQEDGILTPGRMIHVVFKCISNLSQYIYSLRFTYKSWCFCCFRDVSNGN